MLKVEPTGFTEKIEGGSRLSEESGMTSAGGVTKYRDGVRWRNQESVLECIKFEMPTGPSKWLYQVDGWIEKYRAPGSGPGSIKGFGNHSLQVGSRAVAPDEGGSVDRAEIQAGRLGASQKLRVEQLMGKQ